MHYDPMLLQFVGGLLVILAAALVIRVLRQPHVVGYILAGVLLGPAGFQFFTEYGLVNRMGEIGVVLLLFFVGMETSPKQLVAAWRVTFVGTALQIGASVALMAGIGLWLGWKGASSVLLGFVLSLSSTAVVLNYLRDTGRTRTQLGRDTLAVLLAQDFALIPMLLAVGWMAGRDVSPGELLRQGIGAALALGILVWLTVGRSVRLPLGKFLRNDRELQVFLAFGLCLGFALVFGLFHLSSAVGAFLAGMLVGESRETKWVHQRLEPFRVMFVALFFVSIGLLVDVAYVRENWIAVATLTLAVFVVNTAINTVIFRVIGADWRYALFTGAHLAQIGEFSFVLAATGASDGLIPPEMHKLVIAVIALSLLLSPAWIALVGLAQGRPPARAEPGKA